MRAPGLWLGGAAVFALAIGCAADRSVPRENAPAEAAGSPPAPRPAAAFPPAAATIAPAAPVKLPAPVAMPGGGTRIDMRGVGKHVRVLERQPDGTFKHGCVDAPDIGRRPR